MQPLTDDERNMLCWRLRSERSTIGEQIEAADEIERLSSELKSWKTAYAAASRELIKSFEEDGKVRLENAAG